MMKPEKKYIQPQLDFSQVIHVRENTQQNENHLNENRYHFTGQAAVVYSHLQKGNYISSQIAAESFHITDLQRRIGDLGEFGGIYIDRDYKLKQDGKKSKMLLYFMPEQRLMLIAKGLIVNRLRWWFSDKYTPRDIINEILKNKNTK